VAAVGGGGGRSRRLEIGIKVSYSSTSFRETVDLVTAADAMGVSTVWTSEAYGPDVLTPLAFFAARTKNIRLGTGILQMSGRTPAATAMSALTLDGMSGGRLILGLGVSGPQVVEGWHGQPFGRPLGRTREYVGLLRQMLSRDGPVEHQGAHYRIPYHDVGATGLGKPLKLSMRPVRDRVPLYVAAIGPKNVALAAEIADGWLPTFYSPDQEHLFSDSLAAGFAASGRDPRSFEIAASAWMVVGDDVEACRDAVRPWLALHIGGMGARGKNFYTTLACRYGYEREALLVQDLYLDGKKEEAVAAVPSALVDEVSLVGPLPRVLDRLEAWKASGVGSLALRTTDRVALAAVREAVA
jgi:F420-dependent oxidoreductase-like protein